MAALNIHESQAILAAAVALFYQYRCNLSFLAKDLVAFHKVFIF